MSEHTSGFAPLRSSGQISTSASHLSPDAFGSWVEARDLSRTRGGCAHASRCKVTALTSAPPTVQRSSAVCVLSLHLNYPPVWADPRVPAPLSKAADAAP